MKKIAVMLLACCALAQVIAAEPQKLTSVPQALAQARKENKMVLLDFTGSDWCGWCMKFKKETLDTPEFTEYAAKNLVFVELDYPHKTPQSVDLKKANKALLAQHKVESFPTFVLLDKDGKELGRQVGYKPGGPAAFITRLDKFKSKN